MFLPAEAPAIVRRRLRALRQPLSYGLPLTLGLVVFFTTTGRQLAFSTDSVFYWSAARTLALDGHLSTGITYNEDEEPSFRRALEDAGATRSYPLTVFAPGYPVMVALVATCLGLSISAAAWLVNLASAIAIISLAVSFGRRIGGASGGWLAGVLVAVLPFFQGIVAIAGSEPLFTALVLFALLFLTRWLEHPDESGFNLHAAALFGAAATYTRYIGLSFGLVLAVLIAHKSLRDVSSRRGFQRSPLLALGIHWGLITLLFVRNLILTGHVGGADRLPPDIGLIGNFEDVGKGLLHALPLLRSPIAGPVDLIGSGLVLATATAASIALTDRRERSVLARRPWPPATCALASFIVGHGLLLVILRSRVGFETIDVRLLFPALVCLTVGMFGSLGRRVAGGAGFAVAVVWIAASFAVMMLDVSFDPTAGSLSSERERNQPVIRWAEGSLASHISPRTLIFTDDVSAIHFATGAPVLTLPPLSTFEAVDAIQSSTDLLFILGPPGPRSPLTTEAERDAYERALSRSGAQVVRGEGYSAWCLPGSSQPGTGVSASEWPGPVVVQTAPREIRIQTPRGPIAAQVSIRRHDVTLGDGLNAADVATVFEPVAGVYWWRFEFLNLPAGADSVRVLQARYTFYLLDRKIVAFVVAGYALGIRESSERASSLEGATKSATSAVDRIEDGIKKGTVEWLTRISLPGLGRDFFLLKDHAMTLNPPRITNVSFADRRWQIVLDGPNNDRAFVTLDENYRVLDTRRGPRE